MPFTPEEEHKLRNLLSMYPKIQETLSERESKKWAISFLKGSGTGLMLLIGVWVLMKDTAASILEFIRGPEK